MKDNLEMRGLTPADDAALAALIRRSLKARGLDIPGTAYFDEALDRLSGFYGADPLRRAYFVLLRGGELVGGVGLAEYPPMEGCAELQKLYLDDSVQGHGLGYRLIERAEQAALALGYRRIYLETHTRLQAAIHVYERAGYARIDRPPEAVHATMDRFYLKQLR